MSSEDTPTRRAAQRGLSESLCQTRRIASDTHRPAYQESLRERAAADCGQTCPANRPERLARVREQAIEAIDEPQRYGVLALPPALIAAQHARFAQRGDAAAGLDLIGQRFDQRGAVEEPEIHALPRQRMDCVRGIACEDETLTRVGFCMSET